MELSWQLGCRSLSEWFSPFCKGFIRSQDAWRFHAFLACQARNEPEQTDKRVGGNHEAPLDVLLI